jgi:hypothetical protein
MSQKLYAVGMRWSFDMAIASYPSQSLEPAQASSGKKFLYLAVERERRFRLVCPRTSTKKDDNNNIINYYMMMMNK